jgi:hypothetical protein
MKCNYPDASHLECAADHVSQALCTDNGPMNDRDLVLFYVLAILDTLESGNWDRFLPDAIEYDRELWASRQETLL